MNGCDSVYLNQESASQLLHQNKKIVVLTVKNPFTVSNESGIDHDLLENFAGANDIQIEYRYKENESEIVKALNKGEGDIGAARFLHIDRFEEEFLGPTYEETHLNLYCNKKIKFEKLSDLNNKKILVRSYDYSQDHERLITESAPLVNFVVKPHLKQFQILRQVQNSQYDCAMMEHLNGEFYQQYYSRVQNSYQFDKKISLNWLISPKKKYLSLLMKAWFQEAARSNEILRVLDLYRSHLAEGISKLEVYHFLSDSRSQLNSYIEYFQNAGKEQSIPWHLLAALSYQESRWNELAVSHRGAKGLMQITDATAEHLGVIDAHNAEESIFAAAKYLRQLINMLPKSVHLSDRLALALAAYNMGIGHLKDAQRIAELKGMNPYSWQDLKVCLPFLSNADYFDLFEHGYANSAETIQFVDRVFNYQKLLISYR